MERNGLEDRFRERRIGGWVLGVSGFFFISFFLAPWTVDAGTIVDLEGRANAFDFATSDGWGSAGNTNFVQVDANGTVHQHDRLVWTSLNPYAALIYGFGDLNCHQKYERSLEVNANQMPVCTRDVGIFFGLVLGGMAFNRRGWNRWTVRDTCLSMLPEAWLQPVYQKNWRTMAWLGVGLLLCLPLIADGFLQLLTSYESTNTKRILTGVPFGFGLGVLMCSMFAARADAFSSAGQVLLPGSSRFVLSSTETARQESE
ncbi:MAG: DUF2085 domain-containing protein [Candidatus Poseidoniales archaeon]|nr:MAG: DUF2085 domain-containing protein [Candidatus Poseidoniales archaeon]